MVILSPYNKYQDLSSIQEKKLSQKPLIIYDGNCAFCKNCLALIEEKNPFYFNKTPFQAIEAGDPLQDVGDFQKAVYLIEFDHAGKTITSGAEAIFKMLALIGINSTCFKLYKKVAIFKILSDLFYQIIASNRTYFGKSLKASIQLQESQNKHTVGLWLFYHFLSLSFAISFASWLYQFDALFGENGLVDLGREVSHLKKYFHFIDLPNLLFWSPKTETLKTVLLVGLSCSLLSFIKHYKTFFFLIATMCYLTLIHSSSSFGHFQWDTLLIETGFLASIISCRLFSKPVAVILLRLLLFKIIFLSGVAKVMAHTGYWRDLTALFYHFETQPIPTPISFIFHSMPGPLLALGTILTLAIQLSFPFLLFFNRTRKFATYGLLIHQILIAATGNYNFFNLLTIGLIVSNLSNYQLSWLKLDLDSELKITKQLRFIASLPLLFLILSGHFAIFLNFISPGFARPIFPNWYWMNTYGLFANMTVERNELVIEVSPDRNDWRLVDFPHKIDFDGDKTTWIAPYQPRIDWQLWFAALAPEKHELWFLKMLRNILKNPEVLRKTIRIPEGQYYFIRVKLQKFKLRSNGEWQKVDQAKDILDELTVDSFRQLP